MRCSLLFPKGSRKRGVPLYFLINIFFICFGTKSESDSIPEYFLIELQGSLETSDTISLDGTFIGDLHFTIKAPKNLIFRNIFRFFVTMNLFLKGEPVFIIGHHVLYGKEAKLDKPFAVLKKTTTPTSSTDLEPYYECAALIKRKFLFKTRPKPLVLAKKV